MTDSTVNNGPSEFGGAPAGVARVRNRAASDRVRNLRTAANEEQTHITDAAADAIWEGLNP